MIKIWKMKKDEQQATLLEESPPCSAFIIYGFRGVVGASIRKHSLHVSNEHLKGNVVLFRLESLRHCSQICNVSACN